jgi:hypothetical protein
VQQDIAVRNFVAISPVYVAEQHHTAASGSFPGIPLIS